MALTSQVGNMVTTRTVLFVTGVALLLAGFYVQDFSISREAVRTTGMFFYCSSAPHTFEIQLYLLEDLHPAIVKGVILKLAGFGVLATLYFATLRRISKNGKKPVTTPAILGLGSAVCFAGYAVSAPAARYLQWTYRVLSSLGTGIFRDLNAQGSQQLRNAMLEKGFPAVTGMLLLGASLFLFGGALLSLQRRKHSLTWALCVVPFLFQGRRGPSIVDTGISFFQAMLRGSVFAVTALIVSIALPGVSVLALITGRKRPRIVTITTVALLAAVGCLAFAFYGITIANIEGFREPLANYEGVPPYAELYENIEAAWCTSYFLSIALMVSCVILPMICGLSLLQAARETKRPPGKKGSRLPLIALAMTLAFLITAGYFGLRENPYKASLRRVVVARTYERLREVRRDTANLESDEGLEFLRRMIQNPREFFWHYPIMEYVWQHSRHPESKYFVIEMLWDANYPIAASHAAAVLESGLYDDEAITCNPHWAREKQVYTKKSLLALLSDKPHQGWRVLRFALTSRAAKSRFVHDVMETCSRAGTSSFLFPGGKVFCDECLDLPDGFAVHYNGELERDTGNLVVELLWCEHKSLKPSPFAESGRTVAVIDGKEVESCYRDYEHLPDYDKLSEMLRTAGGAATGAQERRRVHVELRVAPLVPARHVGLFLNACDRADISEATITKP